MGSANPGAEKRVNRENDSGPLLVDLVIIKHVRDRCYLITCFIYFPKKNLVD